MPRILHFTKGPQDWQALLADPQKQWRTGYSARTLAHSWEEAPGLPPEVQLAFASTKEALLADFVPLIAVPEFKVALPGGDRASQNDLFVLGRSAAGPVSMMVEGKVSESFGPTLSEWQENASSGKEERLTFLIRTVGLTDRPDGTSRYQLFHRAASAILEGERYRAVAAVMLIHSFSQSKAGWPDYEAFLRLFGIRADVGTFQRLPGTQRVPLFAAWIVGDSRFLSS